MRNCRVRLRLSVSVRAGPKRALLSEFSRLRLTPLMKSIAVTFGSLDLTTLAMTTGPLAVNHTGLLPSVTFSFNLRPGVDLDKVLAEMENQ